MFWESFYADYNMRRDEGKTFKSLYFGAIAVMILTGLIMLCIVLNFGCKEAVKWDILAWCRQANPPYIITGVTYFISSLLSVAASGFLYWWVGKANRGKIIEVNEKLLAKLESDDMWL
jgi:hypothetical protein